jgi:RNA polymerase sigma-70 factor (ECF subfamily)
MMANLETLIVRWGTGDESAAAEIYNLHRERVFRLSYALVGNSEDAEEAAQDALTYALLHIHHFDSRRSKFTTWLHMITVSRCRDLLRKQRIPTLSLSDWLEKMRGAPASEDSPEQEAIQKERQNTVWEAVQDLSPTLREAIVLRHWGGHTYQEIADILGCPIRTAQSRVRLAYQRLKVDLAESNQPAYLTEESL